ncbi:MAG: cell division protein FtsW [Kiritimatiellae bacterium]|nr:cell division protein FtsW [Kiritimatiellia bacterium]
MRKSALYFFGLVVAALVALGLVILSSAGEANGLRLHNDAYFFMRRQFMYLGAGIAVAVLAAAFDYHRWKEWPFLAFLMYFAVLALLCAVFAFPKINGSHRWISLGPLRLQPSEFAKLATVIAVAVWMDLASWKVELFWRGAFWPVAIIGLLALPVMMEPDFGSVMVIGLAGFLLMFVAGTRILHILPFVGLGGAVFAARVLTNANRMARIKAYLGMAVDEAGAVVDAAARNAAHQSQMALVAIKRGGIWGVGLGESMQKQAYLPEAHTDFIFAIYAEELGMVWTIVAILLFVAFFALSVYIARKATDRFGRFLTIGMAFVIFFQAMFNLGVVCGALPTKGMALPFFSYGGTNLLASFFAVGTILSVGVHSYRDSKRLIKRNVFLG